MKILIIHTFGLGDMIMFTPTLEKIREKYPNSEIDFLIFQKFSSAPIKNCEFINKIYYTTFNFLDLVKIIFKLRKKKYDLSFVTSGTDGRKASLLSLLIDARERIGEYRNKKFYGYTKNIKYIENNHRVENNLNLINIEKYKNVKTFYCLDLKQKKLLEKKYKFNDGKTKIIIHIGSNKEFSKKRWKKENFLELIKKLKSPNVKIIIISGPDEIDESKYVSEQAEVTLVSGVSIDEVAFLISKGDIFINTDSGLGHISSCYKNLEIYTIFGPVKSYKAKPYSDNALTIKLNLNCQPCHGTEIFKECKELKCLNNLSVDKVYNIIRMNSNKKL